MIMKGDKTVKNTVAIARSNTLIYSILTHKSINHITVWPQCNNTTWNLKQHHVLARKHVNWKVQWGPCYTGFSAALWHTRIKTASAHIADMSPLLPSHVIMIISNQYTVVCCVWVLQSGGQCGRGRQRWQQLKGVEYTEGNTAGDC